MPRDGVWQTMILVYESAFATSEAASAWKRSIHEDPSLPFFVAVLLA